MLARLKIVSLVILGVAACASPDWVGDAPDTLQANNATVPGSPDDDCDDGGTSTGTSTDTGTGGASAGGSSKPGIDVDISTLPACCEDKGKAHCVPEAKVPASTRSSLDTCSGGLCIPDSLIAGEAPKSCDSGFGPGVCVSRCVKAIEAKASLLKQMTCATNELCAPCISPIDNKPTGACELGKAKPQSTTPTTSPTPTPTPKKPCRKSQTGGTTGAPSPSPSPSPAPSDPSAPPSGSTGGGLATCCGGKGACVPETAVPEEQKDKLEQKECASAQLCAPKENIDKAFVPKACKGESLTGEYDGVCLSNCIAFDFLEKAISEQGSCDSDHRCIPCKTPFGTDTGAPGCQ
jgi:hypothetical protein